MDRHAPALAPSPSSTRRAAGALLVAYMGVVVWLSHQPHPPLPQILLPLSDKVLHAAEYVPLGFLWARLLGVRTRRGALLAVTLSGLFGLTDEVHQYFVPGREASALDLLADVAGAALGVAAAVAAARR